MMEQWNNRPKVPSYYGDNCRIFFQCLVKSITSEATPLATQFFKGITKLAILPDYKRPGMLCLDLPARCKVQKLDFQSEFSMSKIIRIFLIFLIFFIEE